MDTMAVTPSPSGLEFGCTNPILLKLPTRRAWDFSFLVKGYMGIMEKKMESYIYIYVCVAFSIGLRIQNPLKTPYTVIQRVLGRGVQELYPKLLKGVSYIWEHYRGRVMSSCQWPSVEREV